MEIHASFQGVKIEMITLQMKPLSTGVRTWEQVAVCVLVCQTLLGCLARPEFMVGCLQWYICLSFWKPGPAVQRGSSGYLRGLPRTRSPYQSRAGGHGSFRRPEGREGGAADGLFASLYFGCASIVRESALFHESISLACVTCKGYRMDGIKRQCEEGRAAD